MAYQEQYHVFSLPKELLDTLIPRNIVNRAPTSPRSPSPINAATVSENALRACNLCPGSKFTDVDEQRMHFRSDWHRYNVKMRLDGASTVVEVQFNQLVEGLEDSISGSESSSNSDDESSDDAVSALVHRTKHLGRPSSPDEESSATGPHTALLWFHSPPATQIGIYRAIFPVYIQTQPAECLNELRALQRGGAEGRTWTLFMVAGGHFAGAVVRVKRPDSEEDADQSGLTKKGKPKKPKPEMEVLRHKTFHRYTTRRKQGGSQATNDNAKSKAVSAGAMLRRYGEQALRDDIRNLITEWAEDIESCERVYIRASVANRRIFVDYEGAILHKGDDRMRTFPFQTRRPTQAELTRCLFELTRVKVSHLTEDALRAQDEAYIASLPKPKPVPTVPVVPTPAPQPKLTTEELARREAEQILRDKWTRMLDMLDRGRLDAAKAFWAREADVLGGVNAPLPDGVEQASPEHTLLMVATRKGQEDVVRWLLEEAHADPTVDVPQRESNEPDLDDAPPDDGAGDEDEASRPVASGTRRTAYDLARTRVVRNIFRRCAADHPDWYDWLGTDTGGARVPSALSREMEEGREEKKKARRKGLKDRVKERETKEKERAPSPVADSKPQPPRPQPPRGPVDGPRKLGGSAGSAESVAGLTPEMRAKVERERRARAAEARLKTLGRG